MGLFSQPAEPDQAPAKLVRLHLLDNEPSFEGILVSEEAGHYHLLNASMIDEDEGTVALDGEAWVPNTRVLFVQVIAS